MTIKKLEELISINKTKGELWEIIQDCETDCWIEIKTPHHTAFVRDDDFRKSFTKLMRDTYEDCCKKIDDA